jgi:phosphatidylserine decarboxylase
MMDVSVWERIKGCLFHAFPHHLVSRITFRLARLNTRLKDPLVRLYIRAFRVNMSEALEPDPRAYPSFNAFFTRALKAGARPIAADPDAIACPADGTVSQLGDIDNGRVFQAKGQDFSVFELLGGSQQRAVPFINGKFCNIYLSPRDYHRMHMPVEGRLLETVYVPGRLFSVAPYAPRVIPRLFARNERVAAIFATPVGPMAVIMVGAVNVSAIETVWAGLVTPPAGKHVRSFDQTCNQPAIHLARGQEMGRFNMGSTAILLFGADSVRWDCRLATGVHVKMGQQIGHGAFRYVGPFDQALSQEKAIAAEI